MVTHKPWIGKNYEQGIGGQKLLLLGFSHWTDEDHDDFTVEEVEQWAAGDEPKPFGPRLRGYFGDLTPAEFWNSVAFMNVLPSAVGTGEERYGDGTPEQRGRAADRLTEVMREHGPDKVLVFTRKGSAEDLWPHWTPGGTLEAAAGERTESILYGSYEFGPRHVRVYELRHPQFAETEAMTASVAAILAHEP